MSNDFGCEKHRENSRGERPVSRRDFIRATAVGAAGTALAGSQLACSAASNAPRKGLPRMRLAKDSAPYSRRAINPCSSRSRATTS